MDSLKNSIQHIQLVIFSLLLSLSAIARADDDALEQLIKQRQAAQTSPAPSTTAANSSDQFKINYNFIQPRTPVQTADNTHSAKKPVEKPMTAAQALSMFRPHHASATTSMRHSDASSLISSAMGFIGVAYRFGGTTPRGFDCSGFMQYVFRKAFAVNLPRTAAQQSTVGMYVNRSNLQAGDMVFFRTSGRRISHVGMYVGNDRFIHAPRTGKTVEITSLGNRYWSSKYATARRVKRQSV